MSRYTKTMRFVCWATFAISLVRLWVYAVMSVLFDDYTVPAGGLLSSVGAATWALLALWSWFPREDDTRRALRQ